MARPADLGRVPKGSRSPDRSSSFRPSEDPDRGPRVQAWKDQNPPFSAGAFAHNAVAALALRNRPAKERNGVRKKVRIAGQLQLRLKARTILSSDGARSAWNFDFLTCGVASFVLDLAVKVMEPPAFSIYSIISLNKSNYRVVYDSVEDGRESAVDCADPVQPAI